jgi:hypothetical protein
MSTTSVEYTFCSFCKEEKCKCKPSSKLNLLADCNWVDIDTQFAKGSESEEEPINERSFDTPTFRGGRGRGNFRGKGPARFNDSQTGNHSNRGGNSNRGNTSNRGHNSTRGGNSNRGGDSSRPVYKNEKFECEWYDNQGNVKILTTPLTEHEVYLQNLTFLQTGQFCQIRIMRSYVKPNANTRTYAPKILYRCACCGGESCKKDLCVTKGVYRRCHGCQEVWTHGPGSPCPQKEVKDTSFQRSTF